MELSVRVALVSLVCGVALFVGVVSLSLSDGPWRALSNTRASAEQAVHDLLVSGEGNVEASTIGAEMMAADVAAVVAAVGGHLAHPRHLVAGLAGLLSSLPMRDTVSVDATGLLNTTLRSLLTAQLRHSAVDGAHA
eukprot:gene16840-22394_t